MPEPAAGNQETTVASGQLDAKELLQAANSASERLAGMHVAFLAVCAYILVVAFGTTDLDLLRGKGIRLPLVDVEMPILGFYAFAPFLVVLIHFNLLLQLQLLSRKLFAFDAAAPPGADLGGLRDHLHIFPYTYYLVGRPSPLVHLLMALMVSITLVMLPLATLLVLQLQFLAYQNQVVTWFQRLAVWLDVLVIFILWPLIMHPRDDWYDYWRKLLAAHVPRPRVWLAYALLLAGAVLFLFSVSILAVDVGVVLLMLCALSVTFLRGWRETPWVQKLFLAFLVLTGISAGTEAFLYYAGSDLTEAFLYYAGLDFSYEDQLEILISFSIFIFLIGSLAISMVVLWHPWAPQGSLALLLTLFVGLLLPPALLVDGEGLERLVVRWQPEIDQTYTSTRFAHQLLEEKRRLDLNDQVLLSKPSQPETLAQIRSPQWQEGLKKIDPLILTDRHLRHAQMKKVILVGADLRKAQLQGADLSGAQLHGSCFWEAQLQGANLYYAKLQGADLREAKLQGADLNGAELQGADLILAKLQGARLCGAKLQGAYLVKAQLQGADLSYVKLQGADLYYANLMGADLWEAKLYSSKEPRNTELIDARNVVWEPLTEAEARELSHGVQTWINNKYVRRQVLERLTQASAPSPPIPSLTIQTGLAEAKSPLLFADKGHYDPDKPNELAAFKKQLHAYLAGLACESPSIARGLLRQILWAQKVSSSRRGLGTVLKSRLADPKCPRLQGLSPEDKDELQKLK